MRCSLSNISLVIPLSAIRFVREFLVFSLLLARLASFAMVSITSLALPSLCLKRSMFSSSNKCLVIWSLSRVSLTLSLLATAFSIFLSIIKLALSIFTSCSSCISSLSLADAELILFCIKSTKALAKGCIN